METNKTYNENCLDTMRRMPDGFIDLTVTSPPYDNLRDYNGYSFDFESIAKELYRVTKPGGVVVWVVNDATIKGSESGTSFKQALFFKEIGFNLHDTMIYKSEKPPINHNRYAQKFEFMFVLSKGKPKAFNPIMEKCVQAGQIKKGMSMRMTNGKTRSSNSNYTIKEFKIKGNVWHIHTGNFASSKDKIAFKHPAIFPEQLAHDHIISWSNEGDLVYDPFMGSGTTAKMALKTGRNYIGSEMSSEYCEIIRERVGNYRRQLGLF